MTEIECGQLSSCSDSEENSSGDDGTDNLGDSCGCVSSLGGAVNDQAGNPGLQTTTPNAEEDASIEDAEAENDVDDETMSGDNDVFNQPSLLSDLDSLTEPSLESLTGLAKTPLPSNPMSALEDEMLFLRLMDLQGASGFHRDALSSSVRHNREVKPASNALIDSLQLDLGHGGLSRVLQRHKPQPKPAGAAGIAPLPSLATPQSAAAEKIPRAKAEVKKPFMNQHLRLQDAVNAQKPESQIMFGAHSGPISVLEDVAVPKPSVSGPRGLLQDQNDVPLTGLSPVVTNMTNNDLASVSSGPLPAATPLPTLVEAKRYD